MKEYGQATPLEYDVSRIRTPVALFIGENDELAHPVDNKKLSQKLTNLVNYQVVRMAPKMVQFPLSNLCSHASVDYRVLYRTGTDF